MNKQSLKTNLDGTDSLPLLLPHASIYSNRNTIGQKIEKLKEKVFTLRPVLAQIVKEQGKQSLFELATSYIYPHETYTPLSRKEEVIKTIANEIRRLLGEHKAQSCERQLRKYYYVSTTDHHTPLSNAGFLNGNILASLPYADINDNDLENIIVLSLGNVSFDNHSFARGLLFHSEQNNQLFTNQLVFFPRRVRPMPVVNHESYTQVSLDEANKRIDEWIKEGILKKDIADKICFILDSVYAHNDVLNKKVYTDQITLTNAMLWENLFKNPAKKTNLVYLEQGDIVNQLLLKYHIYNKTPISDILFDPYCRELFAKYFDGINGAFSSNTNAGTFLFWAHPKNSKYRVQLFLYNGKLVAKDFDYEIDLAADSIASGIRNKELIPGTALSFILLSFYYGLRLLGGMSQTTYLPQMRQAYTRLELEYNKSNDFLYYRDIEAKHLYFSRAILSLLNTTKGMIPATSIDLILYGKNDTYTKIKNQAKKTSLEEAMYRVLPNLYNGLCPESEKDQTLCEITEHEIDKYTGLSQKLVPLASL